MILHPTFTAIECVVPVSFSENGVITCAVEFAEGYTTPGARPQLYAPTAAIDGDTLTIQRNADNGAFTTAYALYIDGSPVGDYADVTIDLTTLLLAAGTYAVTVKAKGTNFVDSVESEAIEYFVPIYTEEDNDYGTTVSINSCEEEANDHGTTVIL